MPWGEEVALVEVALTDVVVGLADSFAAVAGWDVLVGLEGVVRGGAAAAAAGFTAGSVFTVTLSLDNSAGAEAFCACAGERGGASRSSSRAAGRAVLVGLIKPVALARKERRLIRGLSVEGLSKLNSAGTSSGSGCVAGS